MRHISRKVYVTISRILYKGPHKRLKEKNEEKKLVWASSDFLFNNHNTEEEIYKTESTAY